MKRKIVALVAVLAFCTFGVSANAAGLKDIFNAKYYADQYKDLYDAFGYDEEALYDHYLTYGINEGRSMNPIIDVVKYREGYEDLDTAFGDNWDAYVDHYFTYGIKEKRDNGTDFDIAAYVEAYDDIEEAFGNDFVAIAEHYQTFGINENRQEASKVYQEVRRQEEIRKQEEVIATPTPDVSDGEQGAHTVRTDFEDGSYCIEEYDENGMLVEATWYYANDVVQMEEFYFGGVSVKSVFYKEDGSFDYSVENIYYGDFKFASITINFNNVPKAETQYNRDGQVNRITYYNADDTISWEYSLLYLIDNTVCGSSERYYYADGTSTETIYDLSGNIEKKRRYEGENIVESEMYDENGDIEYGYVHRYDSEDRLIESISYNAEGTTSHELREYIESGCRICSLDEDGRIYYVREFDTEGGLRKTESINENNSKTIEFYDGDNTKRYRYEYHNADGSWTGRNLNYEYGGVSTEYMSYDAEGNQLMRIVYEYQYGETAVLIRQIQYDENDEFAFRTEYSYDENGVQTSVTYDKNGNEIPRG